MDILQLCLCISQQRLCWWLLTVYLSTSHIDELSCYCQYWSVVSGKSNNGGFILLNLDKPLLKSSKHACSTKQWQRNSLCQLSLHFECDIMLPSVFKCPMFMQINPFWMHLILVLNIVHLQACKNLWDLRILPTQTSLVIHTNITYHHQFLVFVLDPSIEKKFTLLW